MIKSFFVWLIFFSNACAFAQSEYEASLKSVNEKEESFVSSKDKADEEVQPEPKTTVSGADDKGSKKTRTQKAVFLGHLLTPTTYLPPKQTVTAGSHILSYSFSDNLMFGTSTFLLLFYNSPNIYLKYGRQYSKKSRWAVQLNYLKSDPDLDFFTDPYFMETAMGWFIWSREITDFYTFHASLNFMHFFNEGRPHSLRREPFNDQPFQFTATTLHDVRISKHFGLASEIGILGVNYEIPNLHGAVSFRYMTKNLLLQIGVSFDSHVLSRGFDRNAYIQNNPTLGFEHTRDFVTHPEVAFQYFF